jgi:hypothetical protein
LLCQVFDDEKQFVEVVVCGSGARSGHHRENAYNQAIR